MPAFLVITFCGCSGEAFNKTPHQYLIEATDRKGQGTGVGQTISELRMFAWKLAFRAWDRLAVYSISRVGHAPVTFREKNRETQAAKRQIPGCFLVMYKLESA